MGGDFTRLTVAWRVGVVAATLAACAVAALIAAEPASAHAGHDHADGTAACTPLPGAHGLCTHGPDAAPAGVTVGRDPSLRELRRRAATGSYDSEVTMTAAGGTSPAVACIGDGTTGARIQAIYARASDRPDRFADYLPLIRTYAGIADGYVNRSAAQVGSGRRIRFVTDGCKLDVKRVTLSASGDDTFEQTVAQLIAKGLDSNNRKYLVWMDADKVCGVGSMLPDDAAGAANLNNIKTGWSRIDRSCWGGGVEAHEMFHTLGAVQLSAPHSTPLGHCRDENDAMCYDDDGAGPTKMMATKPCPDAIAWQIDCRHDDYFHPKPAAGSYLDKHWNTARSRFLEADVPPPSEPVIALPARDKRLPGFKWGLSATSTVPAGRTIAGWKWTVTDPNGDPHPYCSLSAATTATPKLLCMAAVPASWVPSVTATVTDNTGLTNIATKTLPFADPASPRATQVTLGATPNPLPVGGGATTLTATLTDVATGKPIYGMRMSFAGFDGWSGLADTARDGTATKSRSVTASTDVTSNVYWLTKWWAPDASPPYLSVTVSLPPATITGGLAEVDCTGVTSPTLTVPLASAPYLCGTATPDADNQWLILQESSTGADGTWTNVNWAMVAADGSYEFSLFGFDVGTTYYRVRKNAGALSAAQSPVLELTVTP